MGNESVQLRPLEVPANCFNGYAYHDDSQIVEATVSKFYSIDPRVEVVLNEV